MSRVCPDFYRRVLFLQNCKKIKVILMNVKLLVNSSEMESQNNENGQRLKRNEELLQLEAKFKGKICTSFLEFRN